MIRNVCADFFNCLDNNLKILEHFGSVDGDFDGTSVKFDMLNKRMAKRNAHASNTGKQGF